MKPFLLQIFLSYTLIPFHYSIIHVYTFWNCPSTHDFLAAASFFYLFCSLESLLFKSLLFKNNSLKLLFKLTDSSSSLFSLLTSRPITDFLLYCDNIFCFKHFMLIITWIFLVYYSYIFACYSMISTLIIKNLNTLSSN